MTIKILRTAEHTFDCGDQSVVLISSIEFDDGSVSMLIGDESSSVIVHSKEQLQQIINSLVSLKDVVFE